MAWIIFACAFALLWIVTVYITRDKIKTTLAEHGIMSRNATLERNNEALTKEWNRINKKADDLAIENHELKLQNEILRQQLSDYGIKLDQMVDGMTDSTRVIKEISMEVIDLQMKLDAFEREQHNGGNE